MKAWESEREKKLTEKVEAKLEAEGIDFQDYQKAIKCLSQTVAPTLCIEIYKRNIVKF